MLRTPLINFKLVVIWQAALVDEKVSLSNTVQKLNRDVAKVCIDIAVKSPVIFVQIRVD